MAESIQYAEDRADSAIVGVTYTSVLSLTWTPEDTGDWLIIASGDIKNTEGGSPNTGFRLQQTDGGGTTHAEALHEVDEVDNFCYTSPKAVVVNLDNTSHTFQIQIRSNLALETVTVRNVAIVAIPVSNVQSTVVDATESVTSTDFTANTEALTWTATAGDHIIITYAEMECDNTGGQSISGRTQVDSVVEYTAEYEGESVSDVFPYMNMMVENLTAASHTIDVEAARLDATNQDWRRRRIYAIHFDDIGPNGMKAIASGDSQQAEDLTFETQGTATLTAKNTLTFTPNSQADYYMFSIMLGGGDASNSDGGDCDFFDGTTQYSLLERRGYGDDNDRLCEHSLVKLNLAASSHTFDQRVAESNAGTPDPGIGPKRIIALVEDDAAVTGAFPGLALLGVGI